MAIPRDFQIAARKYGRLVDPIAARYRNPVTGGRLSGEALILKTLQGESGFSMDSVSPVGARGAAQFMPDSRRVAMERFGVDPWADPDQAVHALTLHMRGKINGKTGLEGYNPGDSSYPGYILGQKIGRVGTVRARGGTSSSRGGSSAGGGVVTIPTGATRDARSAPEVGTVDLAGLLTRLEQPVKPQSMGLQAPRFSAAPVTPAGAPAVVSGGGPVRRSTSALEAALAQVAGQGVELPARRGPAGSVTVQQPGSSSGGGASSRGGGSRGKFSGKAGGGWGGSQGPARELAQIGLALGLKPTSTKRHNTNPYSGSGSDHDYGQKTSYAFDLSNGSAPTKEMDQAAFRIARALGIRDYKFGTPIIRSVDVGDVRVQLIYRGSGPEFGGNHLNHVHIGVRRR